MKRLIIIGANNFQLPLILKAKEMGLETHVFAWEKGAVGKEHANFFYPVSITEKEEILEVARNLKPDGVISIGSDLASITVNYIANHLNLPGNSLKSTQATTNKHMMRRVLSKNDLPCPAFSHVKPTTDLASCDIDFPAIVKPIDRSGSRGVAKVTSDDELEKSAERAIDLSFANEAIVEEFVEGVEYSVEMVSWQGKHYFLQVTESVTTGAPYFVETSQHQPANISKEKKEEVIALVKDALDVLGVENGASHSEIIITKDGQIYITEIGARMGGDYIGSDLVELSTGYDFVKGVIEISLGYFNIPEINESNYSGIYYYIPKPGRITSIDDFSHKFQEIVRSEIYYKTGDYVPVVKQSNERPACVIYQSKLKKFTPLEPVIRIQTV